MFQKNDFEIKNFKKLESKGLGESGWGGGEWNYDI